MQSIARNFEKIAFVASDVPEAQEARERLARIADENDAPNRTPPSVDDVLETPAAAE